MAFDDKTRRRLFKTVTACRNLLTEDFDAQLRGRYGIYADEGRVLEIDRLPGLDDAGREIAGLLRERIDHLAAGKGTHALAEAVHRLRREQAFTVLNRFAAVRMAEERELISQSVGEGFQSRGFRIFEQVAGGTALGELYDRYRVYLDCLFDELSLDLGVLFDRSDAMGLLFPGEPALRALFEELNHPEIAPLWAEDETIGWIYQYYNDPVERKKMRKESPAPRNSRELAVRNQFFTPRYVVEFLTDNTLGRIWYEMTKGETRLSDQCRYLVRRPCEFFLSCPDTLYWHDAPGVEEFHEFDRTGDPANLPENPTLGVVLGWAESLRRGDIERALARAGLDRDKVVERIIEPLQAGNVPGDLDTLNPAHLIQALWHLQERYERQGEPVPLKEPASRDPAVSAIWKAIRDQLQNPPDDLSQEEQLKRPVFVPHRPIKDPREIRLLDPACGSMHFGLYAFDLFETIYEEAWAKNLLRAADFGGDIPPFPHDTVTKKEGMEEVYSYAGGGPCHAATARVVILKRPDSGDGLFHTGPYLASPEYTFRTEIDREMPWMDFDYREALSSGWMSEEEGERLVRETDAFEHARMDPLPSDETEERFRHDVPKLIIEHNIHGVDIDPRAVQIAGLSLWLRAQKAWKDQGVRASNRPQVRRSNIVCAEPMPGSPEMLEEFVATLDPPLLGELVKTVFDKMQLAGEAGSLLKIEEEIRIAIDTARKEWLKRQDDLLTRKDGSQEEFFDSAEQQVIDALRAYAERADADSYQRRLFADDAARGFAFIDLCRKRYDAVVMNPPFGEFSKKLATVKKLWFPNTWQDILAAFTHRFRNYLTECGLLGAITSRTGFFLPSLKWWREEFLANTRNPVLLVDLGDQVMDDATVESAAYVIAAESAANLAPFFRMLGLPDRMETLQHAVDSHNIGHHSHSLFLVESRTFQRLRQTPLAYWAPPKAVKKLEPLKRFVPDIAEARQGLVTGDADRFVRVFWEIPLQALETSGNTQRADAHWFPYVMRGSSQPWFSPLTIVVNWRNDGQEVRNFFNEKGELRSRPRAMDFYFRPGFSWTRRAVRFVPYVIPRGCIPSASRYLAFPPESEVLETVALTASNTVSSILRFYGEWFCRPNYLVEHLKSLPWPSVDDELVGQLRAKIAAETNSRRVAYRGHEPFHEFLVPTLAADSAEAPALTYSVETLLGDKLDESVADCFGLSRDESIELSRDLSEAISYRTLATTTDDDEDGDDADEEVIIVDSSQSRQEANLSYFVGLVLGRWDIRYATGERQPPRLPDPFDPLPVCPPGMLQSASGLPAGPEDVSADYPLRITWSGILVDDENHPEDIVAHVREALRVVWDDSADDIEAEACEILGVKAKPKENLDSLRVYFRDPNRFFKDHLARYTKSQRKAPIYWPLATDSGSYTLWIYYHRLDSQTLYTCVSDFIDPKREAVGREAEDLARRIGAGGSSEERQRLEDLTAFQAELKTLRDRLLEVAALPYRPNLNDGVQITAAPLWKCFRLSAWQKVLKDTWKDLEKGKYDWAHLALPIWPARVVANCAKDRSLAIAHGLEDLLWVPDVAGKKKDQLRPLKSPDDEIKELFKAGFDKKDVDRAAGDVQAAESLGIRDNLWVEMRSGAWRRRPHPKDEVANEVARLKGV